jgi:mandelamide amidase
MRKTMISSRREFLSTTSSLFGVAAVSAMLPARELYAAGQRPLTELSAVGAVAAMRNGDIQAEDYARALLDRADALGRLNAFRAMDREICLEAARAADQRRAKGARLGPLHGLPFPVKDSVNTKSLPTTSGTPALKNFRPKDDAGVLKALFAQGAILMGKTNLQELSYGWTSNNLAFGPVRNPYDPSRIPGGSSGGSGVAVAAHMAPLAVAEDTLGSIRVPASMCGVVGFRPTVGRYPADGVMPITPRFDMTGPLSRSVEDATLFDSAVTGDSSPVTSRPLKGVRIGVAEFLLSEVHPEVSRVMTHALSQLQSAGAVTVRVDIPEEMRGALACATAVLRYETVASISAFLAKQEAPVSFDELVSQASPDLQGIFRKYVIPGAPEAITRAQYDAALVQLDRLRASVRRHYSDHNLTVLAFPTVRMPPPLIGEDKEVEILGQKVPWRAAIARNVAHGSCAGMPCLVLPGGMSTSQLPIGIEFDALPGQDRELLALGLSLEKVLGPVPPPKI